MKALLLLALLAFCGAQEDKQLLLILPEQALQNINLAGLLARISGVTGQRTFTFNNEQSGDSVPSNLGNLIPNIPDIYPPRPQVQHSAPLNPYAASLSSTDFGRLQAPASIVDVPSHPNVDGSPGEPDNSPLRANRYDSVAPLPQGPQAEAILLIPAGNLGNLGELSGIAGLQKKTLPSLIKAPAPSNVFRIPVQPSAPLDEREEYRESYSTVPEVRAVTEEEVAENQYSHAADSLSSRQESRNVVIMPIPQPSQGLGSAPASSSSDLVTPDHLLRSDITYSAPDLSPPELIREPDYARDTNYGPPAPPDPSQPTPYLNYAPQYKSAAFGEQGDSIRQGENTRQQPVVAPVQEPVEERFVEERVVEERNEFLPQIEFPSSRDQQEEVAVPIEEPQFPTAPAPAALRPLELDSIPQSPALLPSRTVTHVTAPATPSLLYEPEPVRSQPSTVPVDSGVQRPPSLPVQPPVLVERPPAPVERLIKPAQREPEVVSGRGKAPAPPPPPPSVLIKSGPVSSARIGRRPIPQIQPPRAIPIPLDDNSSPPTAAEVRPPAPIVIKQAPAPPPVSTRLVVDNSARNADRDQAGNLVKLLPKKGQRLIPAGPPGFAAPKEELVDLHRWCCFWASKGQCSSNSDWMLTNCRKSCSGEGCAGCVDDDSNCSFWQSKGHCESNPSYMNFVCRKTCGQCSHR